MSWTASALIFSGRQNPTWTLDDEQIDAIHRLWDQLSYESPVESSGDARLGYSGVEVSGSGGRFVAGNEAVTYHHDLRSIVRNDPDRRFETAVLATAPSGVLPDIDLA